MEELWAKLKSHAEALKSTHLRELLADETRNNALQASFDNIMLDFSRSKITEESMELLGQIAGASGLFDKIKAMYNFEEINITDKRKVYHVGCRLAEGEDAIQNEIHEGIVNVNNRIREFSKRVRGGEHKGATGKQLKNILAIGIGGSYLGPEFLHEALLLQPSHMSLKFLSNVDPVDFMRTTRDLDPSETLAVIVSKSFTTPETMMNADRVRKWLIAGMSEQTEETIVAQHMVACSTALNLTSAFGISDENTFGFWDWIGGRFSGSGAPGLVPLYLKYGEIMDEYLRGARTMDVHYRDNANPENWRQCLPILMGLVGILNIDGHGHTSRSIAPYSQSL